METYRADAMAAAGVPDTFVQDNHSRSTSGVLRGLHYQVRHPQAKLCRVTRGEVLDVAVDIRVGSPHFGKWVSAVLSQDNKHALYIPKGFAHGFAVRSEVADFLYKCSDYYDAADDCGVLWSDPALGIEWDTPSGEVAACGGIFAVRSEAFREVGGFDPGVIAAEDDECCLRLRRAGWKVLRVDAEMATHDMAMTRFGQWWHRAVRNGHAYAEGAARHGRSPQRHWVREARSNWFWGLIVPLLALGPAWPSRGLSLLLVAGYPALWLRIARRARGRGWSAADARLYAWSCTVGKFPQALGQAKYSWRTRARC